MQLDKTKIETNLWIKRDIGFPCDCTFRTEPIPHLRKNGKVSLKLNLLNIVICIVIFKMT